LDGVDWGRQWVNAREGMFGRIVGHPNFVVKVRFCFRYVTTDEEVGETRYQVVKNWSSSKPEFVAKSDAEKQIAFLLAAHDTLTREGFVEGIQNGTEKLRS
jgi:hypothetical protein